MVGGKNGEDVKLSFAQAAPNQKLELILKCMGQKMNSWKSTI